MTSEHREFFSHAFRCNQQLVPRQGIPDIVVAVVCSLLDSGKYDESVPMLSVDNLPPSFVQQHRECCARFTNWQTTTILSNIASFDVPLDEAALKHLRQLKQHYAVAYVSRYCLRAIEDSERVVPTATRQVQLDSSVCMQHVLYVVDVHFI